jgi:hypothetical protein
MKWIRCSAAVAAITAATLLAVHAETPTAGYVDFGKFSPSQTSKEFVEVNINGSILSLAAKIAKEEDADAAELLKNIQAVRVNVIGLTDENREEMQTRVKDIRSKLDSAGWQRVVTVANNNHEDVAVFLKTRGEEAIEGIVVTVMDGKNTVVLVNVVGDIKPEKLAELARKLDIEPLKKIAPALKK